MKNCITIAALLAAGTAFANAEDITVDSGRTELTSSNDNTYTVENGGQLFLNSWSGNSRTPTTFACDVVLNGTGYAQGGDGATAALRVHEQSTLAGTLTIGASANLWSSGSAGVTSNVISGDVVTTDASATLSIVHSAQSNSYLLTFSGSSIELPTLDVADGALVAFDSQNITFSAITGTGSVTFNEGSLISITDSLSISASSLTFGNLTVSETTTVDDLQSFFSGDIKSVSYSNGTLTVSTIPEPSAFGLLAGVGALALVAARRRRSK